MIPIFRASSADSSENSPAVSFVKLNAASSILKTIERSFSRSQVDTQQHSVLHSIPSEHPLIQPSQQTASIPGDPVLSSLSQHALRTSSPLTGVSLQPPDVATNATTRYQMTQDCQQLAGVAGSSGSPSGVVGSAIDVDVQQSSQQQQLLTSLTLSQAMAFGISVDMSQSTTDNTGALYLHT